MNLGGARHDFMAPCSAPPRKVNEHAVKALNAELRMARFSRKQTADRETNWLDNAMRERAIRLRLEAKITDLKAAIVELGGTLEEVTA